MMMNISIKHRLTFALLSLASLTLSSCATRDVFPVATIVGSSTGLGSNGESIQIIARLNGPTNRELNLPLVFSGNALPGIHFSGGAPVITIYSGLDSGIITLQSIPRSATDSVVIQIELQEIEGILIGDPFKVSIPIVNPNLDTDNDSIPDIEDDCPDTPGPIENNGCPWPGLILNEILYDPPADLAGDANKDGVRDPLADEFIEIFNDGPALDLSGFTVSDASMVRHTFAPGTVLPQNGVLVVFGGGNPLQGAFGSAQVVVASSGQLNLNNAGDLCILKDASGAEKFRFDIAQFSGDPNEAYNRNPDLRGDFVLHSAIPETGGELFSPGLRLNGTPFTP
ncbi:MAG: lamin tail domain-containing protein [Bacteroidia bacterium]